MAGELIKAEYQSLIYEFRGYKVMEDTDWQLCMKLKQKF